MVVYSARVYLNEARLQFQTSGLSFECVMCMIHNKILQEYISLLEV